MRPRDWLGTYNTQVLYQRCASQYEKHAFSRARGTVFKVRGPHPPLKLRGGAESKNCKRNSHKFGFFSNEAGPSPCAMHVLVPQRIACICCFHRGSLVPPLHEDDCCNTRSKFRSHFSVTETDKNISLEDNWLKLNDKRRSF